VRGTFRASQADRGLAGHARSSRAGREGKLPRVLVAVAAAEGALLCLAGGLRAPGSRRTRADNAARPSRGPHTRDALRPVGHGHKVTGAPSPAATPRGVWPEGQPPEPAVGARTHPRALRTRAAGTGSLFTTKDSADRCCCYSPPPTNIGSRLHVRATPV